MTKPIPHGTNNGYKHHKCRCAECKAAHSESGRRYRDANPDVRRRWVEANSEKYAESKRRWRSANREREAENCRAWREANPDARRADYEVNRGKVLEQSRRWAGDNPERKAESNFQWKKANPERVAELSRLASHRRRARKRDAFIEDVPPLEIFERDGWQCRIPGCLHPDALASSDVPHTDPLYASIDHVVPLSKGGRHERSNVVCAHLQCNRIKQARIEGIA